jgi:hypothetical protein
MGGFPMQRVDYAMKALMKCLITNDTNLTEGTNVFYHYPREFNSVPAIFYVAKGGPSFEYMGHVNTTSDKMRVWCEADIMAVAKDNKVCANYLTKQLHTLLSYRESLEKGTYGVTSNTVSIQDLEVDSPSDFAVDPKYGFWTGKIGVKYSFEWTVTVG